MTTTVVIAVRIQRERVGELRQFASGGAYDTPVPAVTGVTPSVTVKPSVTVTQVPTVTSEQPKGGYTLDMILNPDANTAAGRTGYNCAKGGCPEGVEVSGFYKAPNGRYYPVASSGGPTNSDLAYVYKRVEEKVNEYASLKEKLSACSGSTCTAIQNQMNQLKTDLGYTSAKLEELIKPAPVDEAKVKKLEQYQTLVAKYQTCLDTTGFANGGCQQLLSAAQQFATTNGFTAEERAAIDHAVKVNSLINAYVEAGLKLSECQSQTPGNCSQYSGIMSSISKNKALSADELKQAKDALVENQKISMLLNTGVTKGLTPSQIISSLVSQTDLTQAEAKKMVSQATLSMATNVLDALQKTTPGGEVAIYTQLFPNEKNSACAKDIACVQQKLTTYIHTNAPTLDAKYKAAINELNLSRDLAKASDATGYDAAQLLATLKVKYKSELGSATVTNLDQAISLLNKKLPDRLQTDEVSVANIDAIVRQATGQQPPKTSLQTAYEAYKNERTPDGVRISPEKEKALQKAFEAEQIAALERMKSSLGNDYNKTLAAFYKGELVPTVLEDQLHPVVVSTAGRGNGGVVTTSRVGYTWLNKAMSGIESTLDATFGLSASEAKSEAEGVIDLYGLKVTPATKLQLEAFYENKTKLESAGYFRSGEESEQALIQQIAAGNFDVTKKVESMGTFGSAAMEALHVIDSVGDGWVTQRLYPNLTNIQEAGVAKTYVKAVVSNDPAILTAVEEKIQTNDETRQAYETYKKSAAADEKTVEDFLIHQYQAALDVQDKAAANMYDAPAIQSLFPQGTQEASWLRQAALEGTIDVQALSVALDAAKRESTLAENALNTESYRRGNSQENISAAASVVQQKNFVQAELLAEAYINSIPEDVKQGIQKDLELKLKDQNTSIDIQAYQKEQLASYLNDADVQFLMGSGGVDITMQGVLNGTYDMKVATRTLSDIKANDPLAAMALGLNKFENGALLQGQQIMDDPKSTFGDKFRAGVMMSAKPALTAVAIVLPPLRLAQLAGTAITAQTALAVAGDAMGVYMTGSSLQDTATVCTFRDGMDTSACVKSAGMTLFAASSALSSASQLNSLARAARVTRLEQGVGTGVVEKLAQQIDAVDIGWTSTVGKTLTKNPVTSLLVSKGNLAVADLAVFTRQAGATSFEGVVAALPKVERAALNISAMTAAEKVAFTNQALAATQTRIAQNLASTVYSGAAESMVLQTARNGLGTLVFGSAAVDACSQAVDLNCLTSFGLFGVSAVRLFTGPLVAKAPQSLTAQNITRADQLVNYSQAAVACSAAAMGKAAKEACMTNIIFAGLSAGQTAIRDAQSAAPIVDDPFTLRTQALADAAVLGNEFYSGNDVIINGKPVRVTGDNRAALLADVQSRLTRATTGMAQIIGRTNSLVAGRLEDAKSILPDEMSTADKGLATAMDAWRSLINADGTIKQYLIVDGPAEADGTPARIAVTDRMIEDAYRAVTAAERQVAIETQLKAYPERSNLEQLGDRITELLGRNVPELTELQAARSAFVEAAKTADTNPVAYEIAAERLGKAKTEVERMSMTSAQRDLARQLDAEQEALQKIHDDMAIVQLRIELLQDPEKIDAMLLNQGDLVRDASGQLVRALAAGSDETVIAAARKKLNRAQEVYETVQQVKQTNDTITGEGKRATLIRTENDLALGPLVTKQLVSAQKIAVLEQSIQAGNTLRGRIALAAARIFNIEPASVENVSSRELRVIKTLISKQLGIQVSEEHLALYREFAKANEAVNRVMRSVSILDRYDPARTGVEGPLTETRAQRLAQIEEISKGYFQDILPDGVSRSIEVIRADIQKTLPEKRVLFRTQSTDEIMRAFDALIDEHQALIGATDRDAVLTRHDAAMERLNSALEKLYGRDTPDFLEASIAVRKSLKQIDLATQIQAAELKGDIELAARLRKSTEVNLSMFNSLAPETRLKLENIIRDTEYRLTIYEQDFRSLRAKQLETIFGLLSNDGTAIELTTSGGKTWVVTAISRVQNEVFDRKAVIVFRKGQAGQLTEYVRGLYGSDDAAIRVTSDMFQGDERVTADALKRMQDAKVIVVEPEDLPFLRNMATMKYDNPKVRADVIHAYLTAVSNAGFSIDELNLALDTNSRMINPANGQNSVQIEERRLGINEDVGKVILDLDILQDGKFDAWRTSENGKSALTEGYQVTKTNPDGSVSIQVIKNAKFTDAALERLLPALEKKFGLDEGMLRKVSELRDANRGTEAFSKALVDAGISPEVGAQAIDVLGAVNNYANVMTAVPGTAYFRGVNVYGARVTIPGSEGVASAQQTYNKYLQPVYEIVGALAHGEGFIPLRGSGLAVAPELAYQSTMADVIADAMILSGNVQIGGVTGTIGSAYDVLANAYRMVTNVDGETARRIFDEGRLSLRRFTVVRQEDVMRVLAEQIKRGIYDTSKGLSSHGNLKITLGGDLGLSTLEVAREIVRQTGNTDKTFVIGVNGDTFYEVKLNADGTIAEGFADEAGNPNKIVTTDDVSRWYMNDGRENVISILDRGSATGGNIRTPEYVPGALLTSDTAPEYLVLQAASRLDRTGGLADQHLILAKSDAQAFADSLSLDALSGTPEQFAEFRKNAIAVQDAYAKEQSAQANTLGMELAASRPLAHGVMMFGTIDSPAARQVADWLSDRLLEMSTHEDVQDTSLKQKTAEEITADSQQKTLAARNERFKQLVEFYDRLFENPDNQPYLKMIQETAPDIYTRMLNSRNALVDVKGVDPLSYATTQGGTSKDAPLLQGDLLAYKNAHNISVTQESEAYFTGGAVDEKRIAQAKNQAETIQNEQLAEGILSQQGKSAVAVAERAKTSTRQLSTRNRETLTLVERAVAFYQQRVTQANSLIALNALQRQQTAHNANGVAEGDVVVGQFEPAELIPCAVRNPFVSYVLAAGPCAPAGVAPIKPQRVAVTIQNGLKASYTDASGTYDFVFDGSPLISPLGVITSMVLHYEAGDVTLGEEDLKRMTAGDDVRAISIETYLNASQTIQQVTQQLHSWGITDAAAAAITQSVRRDAENRIRSSVGGGSLDTDALNRAVDALIAYEQDAYSDLVTMSSGDRKAMTVDILDRRTAVSRSAAATALQALLPGGTEAEASTRLSRISKQTLSDIIVGQRKAVENVQAKAAAQKRNAARLAWWKGLRARMSSALAQTRFGNVISFITGLFTRQPTTGTITIARTDFDRAFFGIREGRYTDAYTMLNTARTRNLTNDPDIEKITSALREDIAVRLSRAIGTTIPSDHPMVTAMLAYETAFVQAATVWNGGLNVQNSSTIFAEDIDRDARVASLRQSVISQIQQFREQTTLERDISPDAIFGTIAQPLIASTFALIQTENPVADTGTSTTGADTITALQQAISRGNYMEVSRIYRTVQANAQTHPIVFNNAMEIIYRDVADRLGAELRVPIAWDHAAVSRIAEYELSILAFTDVAAQDPAIVDYETYFDAGHANASVVGALAQAEAVFDTLAAPLGIQRDGYNNGLRRMINPVMQSIWNEMQLDAKIAARVATARELQTAVKGSVRWQARPTPNTWVKTADAVRAFFFPRLTDLRGFPTATPNNVSALTSYTLRYAGIALIPGVGPALAGGIFIFDVAHTLFDQFGGLVVRFPPLQRILLMDSPRIMAWLEQTNTRNTSLQVLKNIVSGSREGWIESIVNATFLDIGNPNWTPMTAITRGILAYGIHSTILPLHFWDMYRAAQAYTERVTGKKSPVLEYGYEKPDYWSQDRESRTLWIIPRWIVNATPETNALTYILTRFVLPGGQLLIPYDMHRIALGGGLGRLSVSSFNPLAWRWLDIPKRAARSAANGTPLSTPAVSNGTNTSGANQTQPSDTSATSGNAPTQQTSHIFNGITTGGTRGASRYLSSRTWFTVGQFFVPLPARLLFLAVNDAIQFVWYGVHPSSYQWAAERIARIPVLQGIADVLQIPAGRGADERNAYFVSRALFVSPWWVNGLLFAVNDVIRARTWVVQRGKTNQAQNAVLPQASSTNSTGADVSAYMFRDVVISDGVTPSIGMRVVVRYTTPAGGIVQVPARIRGAALSRGSWSVAVDGQNTPIVVAAAQFVPQSVAEPSPAYIALNNLIDDLTSPMAPVERMRELADDVGAIGEIIGQTPTQIIRAFTQDAEQERTQALLDQVRERERQFNELRVLEESRQTAEFLVRNAAYQAKYSSGEHFLPVIVESIATGVIPSFEAWLDSRELWRRMMLARAFTAGQMAAISRVSLLGSRDEAMKRLEDASFGFLDDKKLQALVITNAPRSEITKRISELLEAQHITNINFRVAVVDYEWWVDAMIRIMHELFDEKLTQAELTGQEQPEDLVVSSNDVNAGLVVSNSTMRIASALFAGDVDDAIRLTAENGVDGSGQLVQIMNTQIDSTLKSDEVESVYVVPVGARQPVELYLKQAKEAGVARSVMQKTIREYLDKLAYFGLTETPIGDNAHIAMLFTSLGGESVVQAIESATQIAPTTCLDCATWVSTTVFPLFTSLHRLENAGDQLEMSVQLDAIRKQIQQQRDRFGNNELFDLLEYLTDRKYMDIREAQNVSAMAADWFSKSVSLRKGILDSVRTRKKVKNQPVAVTQTLDAIDVFVRQQRMLDLEAVAAETVYETASNRYFEIKNEIIGTLGLFDLMRKASVENALLNPYEPAFSAARDHYLMLAKSSDQRFLKEYPEEIQKIILEAKAGMDARPKTTVEEKVDKVTLKTKAAKEYYATQLFINKFGQYVNFEKSIVVNTSNTLKADEVANIKQQYELKGYVFTDAEIVQFRQLSLEVESGERFQHVLEEKVAMLLFGHILDYRGVADEYIQRMYGKVEDNRAQIQQLVDMVKKRIENNRISSLYDEKGNLIIDSTLSPIQASFLQAIVSRVNGGRFSDERTMRDISEDQLYLAAASIALANQDVVHAFGSLRTYLNVNIALRSHINQTAKRLGLDLVFGSGHFGIPYTNLDAKLGYQKGNVDDTGLGYEQGNLHAIFASTAGFANFEKTISAIGHEIIHQKQLNGAARASLTSSPTYIEGYTETLADYLFPSGLISYSRSVLRVQGVMNMLRIAGISEADILRELMKSAYTGQSTLFDHTGIEALFDQKYGIGAYKDWMSEGFGDVHRNSDASYYRSSEIQSEDTLLMNAEREVYQRYVSHMRPMSVSKPAIIFTKTWFDLVGVESATADMYVQQLERFHVLVGVYKQLRDSKKLSETYRRELIALQAILRQVEKGNFQFLDGDIQLKDPQLASLFRQRQLAIEVENRLSGIYSLSTMSDEELERNIAYVNDIHARVIKNEYGLHVSTISFLLTKASDALARQIIDRIDLTSMSPDELFGFRKIAEQKIAVISWMDQSDREILLDTKEYDLLFEEIYNIDLRIEALSRQVGVLYKPIRIKDFETDKTDTGGKFSLEAMRLAAQESKRREEALLERITPKVTLDAPRVSINEVAPDAPPDTGEPVFTGPVAQPIRSEAEGSDQVSVLSPDKLPTRELTEDEVWSIVQENAEIRALDSEETRQLVRTYIHGVEIGGVHTLVISQEYDAKLHNAPLDAIIFALIRDKRSKPPMVEYFSPEIIQNAENIPFIGGWFARQFKKQEADPAGGYVKAKYYDELADIAAQEGKDVVVGDIANRVRYYSSPFVWAIGSSLLTGLVNPFLGIINGIYFTFSDVYRFFTNTGQYDRSSVHWYELFDIQQDDGRRIYVAQSLRQLAVEHQPRIKGGIHELPIQLVIYPPAHALRISRYLLPKNNVEHFMRYMKLFIYRASGLAGLDFSIRQFHHDALSGKWEKIGEKSIGISYSSQGTFEDPEMPRSLQTYLQSVHTPIIGPLYSFIVRRFSIPVLRVVNLIRDFRYLGRDGAIVWAIDQAQDALFHNESGVFVDPRIQQISTDILSNRDEGARRDAIEALGRIVRPQLMDAALAARGDIAEAEVQQIVNRIADSKFIDVRRVTSYINRKLSAQSSSSVTRDLEASAETKDQKGSQQGAPVPSDQIRFNRDAFAADHPVLSWTGGVLTVFMKGVIISGIVTMILLGAFSSFTLMTPLLVSVGPIVAFINILVLTALPWYGLSENIEAHLSKIDMTPTIARVIRYTPSSEHMQNISLGQQGNGANTDAVNDVTEKQINRVYAYVHSHPVIGWSALIAAGVVTVAVLGGLGLFSVMAVQALFTTFGAAFVSLVHPSVVLIFSIYLAIIPYIWVFSGLASSLDQLATVVVTLLDREKIPIQSVKQDELEVSTQSTVSNTPTDGGGSKPVNIEVQGALPRISIAQTQDALVLTRTPQGQTPSENPIHKLWLTQTAVGQAKDTLASVDEYVGRIITAENVNPDDVAALDNYIEALFRQYYIDNTLRFTYPDTVLGRYMTTLRSLLISRTTIGDSDMTALSLGFSKLMVPVLRERLLSAARDAHGGTPVMEMDAVAFLTQIHAQVDEIVTNYARSHLKKGLFGMGGATYAEFENPWRNLPQTTVQNQTPVARSAVIGIPAGGVIGGAWFAALWTNLPGFQYWVNQIIMQPEETWNLFRVWVTDQYASLFSNTVNVYERAILGVSPEPVPVCTP